MAQDDDSHLVEIPVASQPVYDGKLLHAVSDRVRLPNGREATREYVIHPGAACIVPVLDDGRFVMVRQYRHPLRRVFLEFPAGKIDPGETPIETAKRELVEEVGYQARAWTRLGRVHPVISYSTEFIELFLATGLLHVGAKLDEGEFMEVVTRSLDELLAAYDAGEITDSKTIASLLHLVRRREGHVA